MKALSTYLFIAGFFVIAASCKHKSDSDTAIKDDVIPVKVQQLHQEQTDNAILVSGQFTTDDETIRSFKTGGIIDQIMVKEGDAVKKGQLLATLHLTEINALAQQAMLGYQKTQRDYERALRLYKDSVATLEQMQNAKTAMDLAKQQLETAQFNRSYSEIRATADGFILKKYANEGQMVAPGTPVLQTNGAAGNNWLFKAGVSDRQWSAIAVQDPVSIETDAFPDKTISGTVFKKSEGIDPQSGTFIIQIKINQTPRGLASGLFGRATITPSKQNGTWSIPYDALLDGNNNEGYVFVTNDNKTAHRVKVSITSIQNGRININSGLEHAGALIISGSAYLDEGSSIKIMQ